MTVLFWNPESAEFSSWGDARPLGSGDGFDPIGAVVLTAGTVEIAEVVETLGDVHVLATADPFLDFEGA